MKQRPFEPADLPRLIEIYTAAVHSLGAPYYSPEQLAAWAPANPEVDRWRARFASVPTMVAESAGAIAGFISYRPDGYIDLLFTHPSFARSGVATGLYRDAEATLRNAGQTRLFTHASLAGQPFFARHGFQVESEETVEIRGLHLRRFRMYKQL
jgi:putative acetyltransferase